MSKFVVIPNCRDYYFKLPNEIETLEDEKVEKYYVKYGDLHLKLKGNDEWFIIEPTYTGDEGWFEHEHEYYDEKDTPFYESEEEEPTEED